MNLQKAREIILSPIVTEKSTIMREAENKYVFQVDRNANRIEIAKAVERLFTVKVVKISMLRRRGKLKRLGRFTGRRPATKRAICTLAEGEKIELFEGS